MMTSSNVYIFRVTGHLCGEFTGPRWIPRTKASDGWVNNREAGDLIDYRVHYDVIVMKDPRIDVDKTSIRRENVGWISNQWGNMMPPATLLVENFIQNMCLISQHHWITRG